MFQELKSISSTEKDIQNFSRVVGGALLVFGMVFFSLKKNIADIFFLAGGVLILLGMVAPLLLRPLQRLWMAVAFMMGWIMTQIILLIFYFAVVTPIGLLVRLSGKRLLEGWRGPNQETYWKLREDAPATRERYEQQF